MKVKELVEALLLCDQELEVYGYCDSRQTPEKVQLPSIVYADSLGHTLDDYVGPEDAGSDDYKNFVKAIIL
jgi:hypothetical protein